MKGNKYTNPQIRELIDKILITDSMLDAFLLDYYPNVKKLSNGSMDRIQRVSLLLEMTDVTDKGEIVENLCQAYPQEFNRRIIEIKDPNRN